MQRKLDKITIHGFQSIRALEDFPLHDLNILIGANGAGKSNFITFFRMLREMVEQRLQVWVSKQGGSDRILTYGIKETSEISGYLEFGNNAYRFSLMPTVSSGFIFDEETLLFLDNRVVKEQSFGNGHAEAKLKANEQEAMNGSKYHNIIPEWEVYHFHDTSNTAGVKRLGALHDNKYLRPDASNLAAFLYKLRQKHPLVYEEIRKTVQLAIPFFDDFVLEPQALPSGEEQIRLLWKQQNSDYALWTNQLSDGSLRFICLMTTLLQPDPPSTIIIDEPELGLHPHALTLLAALIRSASKRMQIIVSTQSVPLVSEFAIDDLIVVEREKGVSVFKRLDAADFEDWLEDYSVGELWEKNILGGRPTQ